MRTFSRRDFEAARDAWSWGRFGPEWEPYRRAASERGFIFPPAGSPEDDRDAEEPTQRAIVYRAIADTPRTLLAIIGRSRSWTQVVAGIVQDMDARREDADLAERDAEWARAHQQLSRHEASEALAELLRRTPA